MLNSLKMRNLAIWEITKKGGCLGFTGVLNPPLLTPNRGKNACSKTPLVIDYTLFVLAIFSGAHSLWTLRASPTYHPPTVEKNSTPLTALRHNYNYILYSSIRSYFCDHIWYIPVFLCCIQPASSLVSLQWLIPSHSSSLEKHSLSSIHLKSGHRIGTVLRITRPVLSLKKIYATCAWETLQLLTGISVL